MDNSSHVSTSNPNKFKLPAPAEIASSIQDWGEHVDSPMRKRPRLDSGGATDETDLTSHSPTSRSTSESARCNLDSANSSLQHEQQPAVSPSETKPPSKVTLNLRSNHPKTLVIPTNRVSEPVRSRNGTESPPLGRNTSEVMRQSATIAEAMDLTAESTPSSAQSPPVVEIEVDDSDGVDEDTYSAIHVAGDRVEQESRLMEEFPFAAEHGAAEAASMLSNALSGKEQIDTIWLLHITTWLDDWLQYARTSPTWAQRAYVGESDFWNNVALIYTKFLNRKTQFGNIGSRSSETSRLRIIQRFFGIYLELIDELVQTDLKSLARLRMNPDASVDLVATRHLKNIETIFKPCQEVALWRILTHIYHIHVEQMQHTWAVSSLQSHSHVLSNVAEYTKLLVQHIDSWPRLGIVFEISGHALHNITTSMRNYLKQMAIADLPLPYKSLRQDLLQVIGILGEQLDQDLDRQTASLSIDLSLSMAKLAFSILFEVAAVDPSGTQGMFIQVSDQMDDIPAVDVPRVLRECLLFKLMWKFVTKGRMELRVQGVMLISEMLVGLWRDYHTANTPDHPILQFLATTLVRAHILEYLVSVESHPQLIGRSRDILGFLFVTHRWTREMTDHFWSAVIALQDRRISAAATDVFAGILSLSQPSQILDFVEKLYELPITAFGTEVRQFMRALLTDLRLDVSSPAEGHGNPQNLCVHLLQLTKDNTTDVQPKQDLSDVHAVAFEMLQKISINNPSSSERAKLYKTCLHEIENRTRKTSGSVDSIFALALVHKTEDLQFLVTEMDLPRVLAQEICAAIDAKKNNLEMVEHLLPEWEAFLKLFTMLVTHCLDISLSHELEEDLWSHLIGTNACDYNSREEAWSYLREIIATMESKPNLLIDRLIFHYLPVLRPDLFTLGMFKFVEASIEYRLRVNPLSPAPQTMTICVPLSDLLWRIILNGPSDSVAGYAIASLSQYHVDGFLVTTSSTSKVAATHTQLIDRSVDQLEEAATKLISSDTPHMEERGSKVKKKVRSGDQVEGNFDSSTEQVQLRFVRTLQFLQRFLSDVRSRPVYQEASKRIESPSPVMENAEELNDQSFVLKYQAFTSGKPGGIRELKTPYTAKFSDLSIRLCKVTGFTKISIIYGGRILDLSANPEQSVGDLADKGLLIVRNLGKIDSPPIRFSISSSAAERAVFAHFDTFYSFLDLSENLSAAVYDFLGGFAAHGRVREAVLHKSSPLLELFPAERRTRTLYSICSLQKCLLEQLNTDTTDERFILHGVRLLTTAVADSGFHTAYLSHPVDDVVASSLVGCLLTFLKERPVHNSTSSYLIDKTKLVDRLYRLLLEAKERPVSTLGRCSGLIYSTIIEVTFHSAATWEAFIAKDGIADIHYWLLTSEAAQWSRDPVRACIENTLASTSDTLETTSHDYAEFYWQVFAALIGRSAQCPGQSTPLLATATTVFSRHAAALADETTLRSYMTSWTNLLLQHKHSETTTHIYVDAFVLGLVRLLSVCVSFLKSFKKPVSDDRLIDVLLTKFLFPPITGEVDDEKAVDSDLPVLDDETRKELYNLCLSLSENTNSYSWLVSKTTDLLLREAQCEPPGWNVDRSRWLRTSTGYAGLRNLTNTCYMNSLVTQLFMNEDFRGFMLTTGSDDEAPLVSHALLAETQMLFANMQNGTEKYAETGRFAYAIQPYDSEHIDVNIQMDVDEFYNLLFDRWESQLHTPDAKQKFRAFYGGNLVTQIKSMDCDHVSEREEPFLAIQCDVKGKAGLVDSLKAYVEGDVMEGDNKYKCESCGGRLVNAVKRSCLKNLPDNLIFHLKRFDFDLSTLQRSKINDEFRFADQIDMTPYHVEHLSNPAKHCEPDVFELVGVLVHNGTAETGHYYSYIRLPKTPNTTPVWAEFNDIEVSEFDPSKIPDQCFGGVWEQPGTDLHFPKSNNAYMLFYRRVAQSSNLQPDAILSNGVRPVKSLVPLKLNQDILATNEVVIRRFCLFGPTHAQFVRSLVSTMKIMYGGICSDDHAIEHRVLSMALEYFNLVFAKVKDVPDVDMLLLAIKRICTTCAECCSWALKAMVSKHENTSIMLLQCPNQRLRSQWADLIAANLQELRRQDSQLYGLDLSTDIGESLQCTEKFGVFQEVVSKLLGLLPTVGKFTRAWDDYFGLWTSIVCLGVPELSVLLCEDLFRDSLELLLFDKEDRFAGILHGERNMENIHILSKNKRPPMLNNLVRLIHAFLLHTNPFAPTVSSAAERLENYDPELRRFPLLRNECEAIVHVDKRTKQMPFISRIMEGMEQSQSSYLWVPGEIISLLLNCEPPLAVVGKIAQSLMMSLDEWLPAFSGFLLKSGLYFCRNCPNIEEAVTVIQAVAANALAMAKHSEVKRNELGFANDYVGQGGQEHLNFFKILLQPDDISCAKWTQHGHSFKLSIIKCSGTWGPPLLLFDERSVREETVQLLEALIFDQFPEHQEDTDQDVFATARTEVIRVIFERCRANFLHAERYHMPRIVVRPTLSIMERCAHWLVILTQEEDVAYLKRPEDQFIIAKFQEAKKSVESWRDEEGDGNITETEWASQFDEDESDDMTET